MMKRKKRSRNLRTPAVMLALLLSGMAAMLLIKPDAHRAAIQVYPTLNPEVTPGAAATARQDAAIQPTEAARLEVMDITDPSEDYLPVAKRGDTDEKIIAITVDDCNQVDNLKAILTAAHRCGGSLTLFPIGQNLSKPGMAEVLRGCVYKLGVEVENHTWSHQRIFRLPEDEMAAEIWKQRAALNEVLGANYEQHFFRLMGGDGENDRRTHNYLKQLGYRGIAGWTISGSDAGMDQIKAALSPGAIFLFHTTDADTEKLRAFIPYAVSQGYRLVTLNRLMGYEDNALTPLTEQVMPAPRPYAEDYRTLRQGHYAWNVVRLQNALRKLGLLEMDGPSTGYFGQQTADAVKRYQSRAGMPVTGEADGETLKRLLGS